MLYSFLLILWTCSLQLRAEEPQLEATNIQQLILLKVNSKDFSVVYLFYRGYSATLVAADADKISVMACDEQHAVLVQDKSQQRVEESSSHSNPHRSGFFDRVVVNKTATPGTNDIAAKTVRHHPLPFPQHPVTNLFFPVYLAIPGVMIGTVPVREECGGI